MNDGYEYIPTKVATEVEVMGSIRQKQGHSCCGCCCDTRRAVIICNVVMICVTVVTVAFMIAGIELVQVAAQTANDDEIKTAGKELSSFPIGLVIAFAILHCVLYGLGIQGGLRFNRWQVMWAVASFWPSVVLTLVNSNITTIIITNITTNITTIILIVRIIHEQYVHVPTKIATEIELMGSIPQKQGHSCCGCCCDARRSVMICNVVNIFLTLWLIAGINADEIKTAGKENSGSFNVVMNVIYILHFVLYCLGVQGAISFTKWQVKCALALYSLTFVLQLVNFNIFGMIITGLFAYPHIFFIRELDNHIMSPETYPNEVQSCCCV